MAKRDIIHEISEIKLRAKRSLASFRMAGLLRSWKKNTPGAPFSDLFPIQAVTIMEVFVRSWISRLIDHGPPFSVNAVSIGRDLKIDYGVISAIHGRVVTLGDVIGHSVSVNRLDQIESYFTALLGEKFLPKLEGVMDLWEVRTLASQNEGVGSNPSAAQPLITEIDSTARDLSRLFEFDTSYATSFRLSARIQ